MIGRRIGHYEVTGELGAGAMGEVYRATDTRLKREVALKMLPARFAADPDRVARLRREAEVLASLSHAYIGQIYGLEPVDDSFVLVLELVEGLTLADRLVKGPVPLESALRIAHQVAAALEAAHERGVVHRDLKPGNVKLTPTGDAKVLDFGLAKGVGGGPGAPDLTAAGAVVGTPAYMAPEQIEGAAVDRRTDIWAFGCVLYEMLAGRKTFTADSVGSLFAAIATQSVDYEPLAVTPAPVRRLVERCLRKDPRRRLRDIGDARLELEDVLAGRADAPTASGARRPPSSRAAVLAIVALLAGVGGALLGGAVSPGPAEDVPRRPSRYSISLPQPPKTLLLDAPTGYAPPVAISPDGRKVAFAAQEPDGARRLYVHSADEGRLEPIPEADEIEFPFFSPDGKHIGYVAFGGDHLYRVALADRSVQRIKDDAGTVFGLWWRRGGSIVYGEADRGLMEMPDTGGEPHQLAEVAKDEISHHWPQVLPDDEHVLFTAALDDGRFEARLLSLATGEVVPLRVQGTLSRFVESPRRDGTGFLLYLRSNDLWAVRLDPAAGKTEGEPSLVVSDIQVSEVGNPHLAVTSSGTLVYEPLRPPSPGRSLVWVDRSGETTSLASGKGYEFPRLSPDGRKVLVAIHTDRASHDIWTVDAETGRELKITSEGNFVEPTWSPDGKVIVFADFLSGNLHTQRLAASRARPLLERLGRQYPIQWRSANSLLFMEQLSGRGFDLAELDPTGGTVKELITTLDNENAGVVSPDGRWLAYVSDETGLPEIYVCRYPGLDRRAVVSYGGGSEPVWAADGRELFFRHGPALYAAAIRERAGDPVEEPRKLFEGPFVPGFVKRPNYDVSRDGRRFVMVAGGRGLTLGRLDVHLHFDEELAEKLGARRNPR